MSTHETAVTRMMLARLRGASSGVFRALASSPGRHIAHDPAPGSAAWQMLLAEMPATMHSQAVARWRGRVDAAALRERFSDRRVHAARQPAAGAAHTLFDLLEQNRVEALGARRYPGVRANLAALAQERWMRARPEVVIRGQISGWIETFALLCRIPLAAPLPESACKSLATSWRAWMTQSEADAVLVLSDLIWDQEAFAAQSLRIIAALLGSEPERVRDDPTGDAAVQPGNRQEPKSSRTVRSQDFGQVSDSSAATDASAAADTAGEAGVAAEYRVYTRAYDASVEAAELYDAETLARRRSELDRRVGNRFSGISRWAHRLQRKLMGLQMRSWQFDREEGELDAGRLSRVATHPLEPLVFKQESEIEFPETVVTLLVDNSGSMRGLPIATAAVCAELLGRVLERCGVKTEILGFTTRSWRGGRPYQDWTAAGRCENPGRLAELRHVIYKSADRPWRRASAHLGAMLADDLLKENIDGEALLWANERLLRRCEPRKILVVISDGAPLDDATLEANDAGYLERHLRSVIENIERRGAVELVAIGIGHDVRSYYRRAVALRSADDLSEAIVTQLIDLFDADAHRRGTRRGAQRRDAARPRAAPVPRPRAGHVTTPRSEQL
jgi:cobaltochelatase CobT